MAGVSVQGGGGLWCGGGVSVLVGSTRQTDRTQVIDWHAGVNVIYSAGRGSNMGNVFSGIQQFTANPDLLKMRLQWDLTMIGQLTEQNRQLVEAVAAGDSVVVQTILADQKQYLDEFRQSVEEHQSQIQPGIETTELIPVLDPADL